MTDQRAVTVLHVARAFSAQPTLGELLGDDVRSVRRQFPHARVLATPRRAATSDERVDLIGEADLVLLDEGVVLAAAGLQALSRRACAPV